MSHTLTHTLAGPVPDGLLGADGGTKRHAACDDCRKRKLKCSGEPTGCTRCIKQRQRCQYSEQKQMGRPRKKQRTSEDQTSIAEDAAIISPEVARQQLRTQRIDPDGQLAFRGLCPGPFTQYIKKQTPAPKAPFVTTGPLYEGGSDSTLSSTSPPTPPATDFANIAYPTNLALWPDYSGMVQLPQIVQDNHRKPSDSETYVFPDPTEDIGRLSEEIGLLPPVPSCPCLPNMYLTLSTLATLSSFPVAHQTIITLQTAARTARSVLYCDVCPRKFQTGMQNVMLLGTLVTVLADAWYRVRRLSAEELRDGFGPSPASSFPSGSASDQLSAATNHPPLRTIKRCEWLTFRHTLIRENVFADVETPAIPMDPTQTPHIEPISPPAPGTALLPLLDAMTRRQTHWHNPETATGEFPARLCHVHTSNHADHHLLEHHLRHASQQPQLSGLTVTEIDGAESDHAKAHEGNEAHFCLTLIDRARAAVRGLDEGRTWLG